VKLEVFDLQGRRLRTLTNAAYGAGRWSVDWDQRDSNGNRMSPGIYLYRMNAGSFGAQRKMVLLP
jgi:flagellar hook assembly protein FlgD